MLLTQTAEYALRAMVVVSRDDDNEPISALKISEQTGIPAPYLSKLLRRLVVHKLLAAKRGRGGGFRLSRPPEEISFLNILEAVDAAPTGNHCAFGWGTCNSAEPCPLHEAYSEVSGAFRGWAERTSLAGIDPELLGQIRSCEK